MAVAVAALALLSGCDRKVATPSGPSIGSVKANRLATFDTPWAMTFLPDERMLVTARTQPGQLWLVARNGTKSPVAGIPSGTNGLLEVVLHPDFKNNHLVYLSYIEPGDESARVGRAAQDPTLHPEGLAVGCGQLMLTAGSARIVAFHTIWRQVPKIVSFPGSGEPGGRLAFSPDARYLFIAAGDRQEFDAVQNLDNTLGKIVRILPDGGIPEDNPYVGKAGAKPEIWTLGHRNPYGLAFDLEGRLWEHEMGPMGGDELNLIEPEGNYGWPWVSYGKAYTGEKYRDPQPDDGSVLPARWWTPVIAPAGMIFYSGGAFGDWRGDAIVGGLQYTGLVRIRMQGSTASEVQRVPLGARIREVEQAPDGSIWVLEDGPEAHLEKLDPVFDRSDGIARKRRGAT